MNRRNITVALSCAATLVGGVLIGIVSVPGPGHSSRGIDRDYHPNGKIKTEAEYKVDGAGNKVADGFARSSSATGALMSEMAFVDGVEHGVSTIWHPNGRESVRIRYVAGKMQGKLTAWTEDGAISETGEFEEDRKVGRWQVWYPKGQLALMQHYKNGVLHGTAVAWHPNGRKEFEEQWVMGEKHGICKTWNAEGELIEHQTWERGTLKDEVSEPP